MGLAVILEERTTFQKNDELKSGIDFYVFRPVDKTAEVALEEVRAWALEAERVSIYYNHGHLFGVYEGVKAWLEAKGCNSGVHLKHCQVMELSSTKSAWHALFQKHGFGTSVHSLLEARQLAATVTAHKIKTHYVLLSNLYETKCKVGKRGMEERELFEILAYFRTEKCFEGTKIFLLGGIDESRIKVLKKYGSDGVAVMSLAKYPDRINQLKQALVNE